MSKAKIVTKMEKLQGYNATWFSKCIRNLRVYEWSPNISLSNLNDNAVIGYYANGFHETESDTTSSIQENVVRSIIDTLQSKICAKKVRPFFNTVNGTLEDRRVSKAAQQFFDIYFDEQHLTKTVIATFRDACIFDRGYVFIDRDAQTIERVMPWQVAVDPKEESYGDIRQISWKRTQYPTSLLKGIKHGKLEQVTLHKYYNIDDHIEATYIPELQYYVERVYEPDILPFVKLNWSNPIKGSSCTSVVDMLYGLAMEIDTLMVKIKDASQLASPLKYFVPQNSDIKVTKLSNRVGEVITYDMPPNATSSPITTATEPFMDPQWLTTLKQFKEDAAEMVGLSMLSIASQKPKGLDSGVALGELEDIESDRFMEQLNSVIHIYVEIAKACIKLFDPTSDVLPADKNRLNIKWQDIINMQNKMKIQYSAAENLSKDPSTKFQQLQMMAQAGIIPQTRIAELMELPDMEQGYSIATNAINAVDTVIYRCCENDSYDIPIFIPNKLLQQEILNTCLTLYANSDNEDDIKKLMKLYEVSKKRDMNEMTNAEMFAVNQMQLGIQQSMSDGSMMQAVSQAAAPIAQEAQQIASGNIDMSAYNNTALMNQ